MDEPSDMHMHQWVPIKLYRTPDRVVIAAPMPGVRREDVTVEVIETGRVILQSQHRGVLRNELFHVEVTVDRDGDEQVWTHEWWEETKNVLLDEWVACGYLREVDLPAAVDATLGTVTYGSGVLVVALPVSGQMRPARLRLAAVGEGRGERVGTLVTSRCNRSARTTETHCHEQAHDVRASAATSSAVAASIATSAPNRATTAPPTRAPDRRAFTAAI